MNNDLKISMARYLNLSSGDFDLSICDYFKMASSKDRHYYDCFCVRFAEDAVLFLSDANANN